MITAVSVDTAGKSVKEDSPAGTGGTATSEITLVKAKGAAGPITIT